MMLFSHLEDSRTRCLDQRHSTAFLEAWMCTSVLYMLPSDASDGHL
jgi:hypothetical protein